MCCCGNFSMYSRSQTVIQDVSSSHSAAGSQGKWAFWIMGLGLGGQRVPESSFAWTAAMFLFFHFSGASGAEENWPVCLAGGKERIIQRQLWLMHSNLSCWGFVRRQISNLHKVVTQMFLSSNHTLKHWGNNNWLLNGNRLYSHHKDLNKTLCN